MNRKTDEPPGKFTKRWFDREFQKTKEKYATSQDEQKSLASELPRGRKAKGKEHPGSPHARGL